MDSLADVWHCSMNHWNRTRASCAVPDDAEHTDEALAQLASNSSAAPGMEGSPRAESPSPARQDDDADDRPAGDEEEAGAQAGQDTDLWVACERCGKWRRLGPGVDADSLPSVWFCEMNFWAPERASCSVPDDSTVWLPTQGQGSANGDGITGDTYPGSGGHSPSGGGGGAGGGAHDSVPTSGTAVHTALAASSTRRTPVITRLASSPAAVSPTSLPSAAAIASSGALATAPRRAPKMPTESSPPLHMRPGMRNPWRGLVGRTVTPEDYRWAVVGRGLAPPAAEARAMSGGATASGEAYVDLVFGGREKPRHFPAVRPGLGDIARDSHQRFAGCSVAEPSRADVAAWGPDGAGAVAGALDDAEADPAAPTDDFRVRRLMRRFGWSLGQPLVPHSLELGRSAGVGVGSGLLGADDGDDEDTGPSGEGGAALRGDGGIADADADGAAVDLDYGEEADPAGPSPQPASGGPQAPVPSDAVLAGIVARATSKEGTAFVRVASCLVVGADARGLVRAALTPRAVLRHILAQEQPPHGTAPATPAAVCGVSVTGLAAAMATRIRRELVRLHPALVRLLVRLDAVPLLSRRGAADDLPLQLRPPSSPPHPPPTPPTPTGALPVGGQGGPSASASASPSPSWWALPEDARTALALLHHVWNAAPTDPEPEGSTLTMAVLAAVQEVVAYLLSRGWLRYLAPRVVHTALPEPQIVVVTSAGRAQARAGGAPEDAALPPRHRKAWRLAGALAVLVRVVTDVQHVLLRRGYAFSGLEEALGTWAAAEDRGAE